MRIIVSIPLIVRRVKAVIKYIIAMLVCIDYNFQNKDIHKTFKIICLIFKKNYIFPYYLLIAYIIVLLEF